MTAGRWVLLGAVLVLMGLGAAFLTGVWVGARREAGARAELAARSDALAAVRTATTVAEDARLQAVTATATARRLDAEARLPDAVADEARARRTRLRRAVAVRAPATPAERAVRIAETIRTSSSSVRPLALDGWEGVWLAPEVAAEIESRLALLDGLEAEIDAVRRQRDAQRDRAEAALAERDAALRRVDLWRGAYLEAEAARAQLAAEARVSTWEPNGWTAVAAGAIMVTGAAAACALSDCLGRGG